MTTANNTFTQSESINKLYDIKCANDTVIRHIHTIENPVKVGCPDCYIVLGICSDSRSRYVLKPNSKWNSTNGGIFNVDRYPAGYKIDTNFVNKCKTSSKNLKISCKEIVSVEIGTDGDSETNLKMSMRTLTHDHIIARICGEKNSSWKSRELTFEVEYLEIAKSLEDQIFHCETEKNTKQYQETDDSERTLFQKLISIFL